jgi:hypothetical protein
MDMRQIPALVESSRMQLLLLLSYYVPCSPKILINLRKFCGGFRAIELYCLFAEDFQELSSVILITVHGKSGFAVKVILFRQNAGANG